MNIMPDGPCAYVDIDGTLIEWERPDANTPETDKVVITTRDISDTFVINKHNIEYVKRLAIRGHVIIFWSAGGAVWANAVVKALGLEQYAWSVMSKPTYFIDDVADSNDFMGKHVFYDINGVRSGYSPKNKKENSDEEE